MKIDYRRIRTRARYIMRQQACYEAERKILPQLCKDKTYYEPLFIYTPGKGTEIFYDFTTLGQDPEFAALHFNENPEEFWILVKDFYREKGELVFLLKQKNAENFERIHDLLSLFWAKIALFIALGDLESDIVKKDIADISYKLRVENDKLIYEATDALLELAKQKVPGYLKEEVDFLLYEEISLNHFPSLDALEDRKKGYVYFKGHLYTNETIEQIAEKNNFFIKSLDTLEDKTELVGTPASKGIVKGKVRIVFEYSQLKDLQKGEILVSPMTTPDFVPFLGNVSGIITDEGGMTCHGAIIAREFGIPTVVGTNNATKILKDGDEVEINAGEGKIRILNR